jgi:UDP-GlcNAc:undecaprenyl-phosphate/decaprenyl-phosphate GlcNAc-1-phosphate transferase
MQPDSPDHALQLFRVSIGGSDSMITAPLIGFVITAIAILALRPVAFAAGLLDRPGGRKTHHGLVPLIGGLAMFVGISTGVSLLSPGYAHLGTLLGVLASLVVIGVLDDRFAISAWIRLAVHIGAAALLMIGTGVRVHSLGPFLGGAEVVLSVPLQQIITVLLLVGGINAFNMLDGMDGLAGITASLALAGLAILGNLDGVPAADVGICIVVAACVVSFLLFNVPSRRNRRLRCFMGDAGSTLLGALIGWLCIAISQQPAVGHSPHPVTVLWMVAIPLIELWSTVIRRLRQGKSPLWADDKHMHHILQRAGLSVRATFALYALVNLALIGIGTALHEAGVPDWVSMTLLVGTGTLVVWQASQVRWILRLLPSMRSRPQPVEQILDLGEDWPITRHTRVTQELAETAPTASRRTGT